MPSPTRLTAPSRREEPAALATGIIGGPVGRFAAIGRRGWTYAAAMLSALASVLIALGVLQKNHCVRDGWGSPGALWRACYSDLPVGSGGPKGGTPWSAGGAGHSQPVLTAILDWFVKQLTPGGSALGTQQVYFAIGTVIIVLLIALTTLATASMVRDTPWLAAHVALSPVLITSALVSFDVFGVALATVGMALWARKHPVAAGILLGAAVMARTYPLVLLGAIVLIALRDGARGPLLRCLAGAAGAIVVCFGLAYAMGGDPLDPYRAWWDQDAGYGSPAYLLTVAHHPLPAASLSIIAVLGWVVAFLLGLYLSGRPAIRTQMAPLALTMLVIVMLTGKSMSVQSCMWVLPLMALVALRWREHLMWAGAEIAYFVMTWLYIAGPSNTAKAMPGAAYSFFLLIRVIAYVGIAWASWESSEDLRRDPATPHSPPKAAGPARVVPDVNHRLTPDAG
ncbi:membrane protein [Flexivirga endophytica]|uniref:Membrane protein n=1 Tax=Flexivirga endophytica TaxID=1849103 RepID=A0A916WRM5_9MICO|nr:hypothetical protein [Flexivirga endophytica]GGB23106.1 membrane protein [Flexivirga endophytica]GHB57014.1 membrane protein [Flexivirga endophytica]